MNRSARTLARIAAAAALTTMLTAAATAGGTRTGTITQPPPPVTASAFPVEPAGTAPADGDGLIPNPQTPDGSPAGPPGACTVTFDSAAGSTSADVNAWIAAHENTITSTTVACLSGTFHAPIHVWGKSATALLAIAPAPGSAATLDLGTVAPGDTNPNQYWSDSGGVSIVDSRSVEIYGLTVQDYTWNGTGHSPGPAVTSTSWTTPCATSRTPPTVTTRRSPCAGTAAWTRTASPRSRPAAPPHHRCSTWSSRTTR